LKEISLHILDVAENGIAAGATRIRIRVHENRRNNFLEIVIGDNGRGIPENMRETVTDPFVTTRTTRRVGLGLSLLKAAALRCNGSFEIDTETDRGTTVTARFEFDHIDRAPVGDMPATVSLLLAGHPEIDVEYFHSIDDRVFQLDTKQVRSELENISLSDPRVVLHLESTIRNHLKAMEKQTASPMGEGESSWPN
jgi:hypothetical protein